MVFRDSNRRVRSGHAQPSARHRAAQLAAAACLTLAAACSEDSPGSEQMQAPATNADAGARGSAGSASNQDPTLAMVATGAVQGDELESGAVRFIKIPYAKPPVGALRWLPPAKPDSWSGVRHEAEFARGCPQNKSAGADASDAEDCLYLNVWMPNPRPKRAPVMVWIHGGGNFSGSAGDKVPTSQQLWFDGHAFAEKHGVVVVTFNYRLGPFGFFAHPKLSAEGGNVGNQGLLDQNMVLHWTHDNIAAFGGDPSNVTIFGESAGSADVCYHVASPKSRGLFARAISESGGCTADLGVEQGGETAARTVQQFAKEVGCEAEQDQLQCLRDKPVTTLLEHAMQPDPTSGGNGIAFSVVVDGPDGFLPKRAKAIFDAGELSKVPYILGSNTDEGTLFLLMVTPPKDDAGYVAALKARFGDAGEAVLAQYPVAKFGGDYRAALARAIGDSGLVCGTHDSARRAAKAGLPVYMYNFNVPWAVSTALGATHASEISHVFGLPLNPTPESQQVADTMNALWAQFAAQGDPNLAQGGVSWPKFAPDASDHDQRLQLDSEHSVLDDFRKDECAFWRHLYESRSSN